MGSVITGRKAIPSQPLWCKYSKFFQRILDFFAVIGLPDDEEDEEAAAALDGVCDSPAYPPLPCWEKRRLASASPSLDFTILKKPLSSAVAQLGS